MIIFLLFENERNRDDYSQQKMMQTVRARMRGRYRRLLLVAGDQRRSFAADRNPNKLAALRQCSGFDDPLCSLRF